MKKIKFLKIPSLNKLSENSKNWKSRKDFNFACTLFSARDGAIIGYVTDRQTKAINDVIYPILEDYEKRIKALEDKVKKMEKSK